MVLDARQVEGIIHEGIPAAKTSGMKVEQAGQGRARLRQPFHEGQLRPGGTISGPTMMGLADAAMYAAILAQLGRLEMAVTSNLTINFLNRPRQADLIADCEIIKLGKRNVVLEVRLYSEGDESPVALVTGTYSLPPEGEQA